MNQVKLAVIYYSATGTVHKMAERLAQAGEKAGADVRLRQVAELAPPEAIASNAAWSHHFDTTKARRSTTGVASWWRRATPIRPSSWTATRRASRT
jgi:NAD(P)H dehydrogenase (quinone)